MIILLYRAGVPYLMAHWLFQEIIQFGENSQLVQNLNLYITYTSFVCRYNPFQAALFVKEINKRNRLEISDFMRILVRLQGPCTPVSTVPHTQAIHNATSSPLILRSQQLHWTLAKQVGCATQLTLTIHCEIKFFYELSHISWYILVSEY